MPALTEEAGVSLAEVYDALTKANCEPTNNGRATCPVCHERGALRFRHTGSRIEFSCKMECSESIIASELEMSTKARVVPMVPRGSGTGTGSGSHPYKGEPGNHRGLAPVPPEPLIIETLSDFLARAESAPPPSWLIDPLVPSAGSVLLVSPPNAGKTFFALVIAKTAALQGRHVVFVEDEGGLHAFGDRIKNLAFPTTAPVSIIFQRGVKLDAPTLVTLTSVAQEVEAPVLVLDPLVSLFIGDENSTEEAKAVVESLKTLLRANPRLLLVLLHHSSKSGAKGDTPVLYAARGSSVFSGWCDTQLNLEGIEEPQDSGRVSFFIDNPKQRDAQRASRQRMTIALGSGDVSLVKASEAARDDRAQRIVEALKTSPEGRSRNAIVEEVGGNKQQVLRTISQLVTDGTLVDGTKGIRLKPHQSVIPSSSEANR
jgi:hypothetical protein